MEQHRNRLADAGRVRELVESAFASRHHDFAAMLRYSSMAVALAEEKRDVVPVDLVAAAWTQYGNALRATGRYEDAERALERAAALPISDLQIKVSLLEITATLHRNTGRFEGAERLLLSAIDTLRSIGDQVGAVRVYNILGITYLDWKDLRKALRAYETALDLLEPDAPVDALGMTGHNLVEALIADGRLSAAASALTLMEPFYRRSTSARVIAKAEWMRALLCRGFGQLPAAMLAYERAYALLITEPRSPELPELIKEMTELKAAMEPNQE